MKVFLQIVMLLASFASGTASLNPNVYLFLTTETEFSEMDNASGIDPQLRSSHGVPIFATNLEREGILAILLSGEFSQNNGALDARMPFYPEKQHLVTALNEIGYRSIAFSDSPLLSEFSSFSERLSVAESVAQLPLMIEQRDTDAEPLFILFDLSDDVPGDRRACYPEILSKILEDQNRMVITLVIPDVPSEVIQIRTDGIAFLSSESIERLRVMDLTAVLMNQLGIELKPSMQGVASRRQSLEEDPVYFRYWSHLKDSVTPAHFGVRTNQDRLVFFYGVDFQETGELADSYEGFLEAVSINQTHPYWLYQRIASGELLDGNEYENSMYSDRIDEMKHRLLELRLKYGEGDRNFPHIQDIIDSNWE